MILKILILFTLLVVFWYYRKYYKYFKVRNMSNVRAMPIIGHVRQLINTNTLLENLMRIVALNGNRVNIMLGFDPYLFVTDNELIAQIVSSPAFSSKDETYDLFVNWLGTGLLTSKGKKWIQRRKLITPTFHFQNLNNYLRVFDRVGDILISKLRQESDKFIDVFNLITLYALDTICETALATRINALTGEHSEYVEAVRSLLNVYVRRRVSVLKKYPFTYMLTPDYWRERKLVKYLHEQTYRIIRERRLGLEKIDYSNDEYGIKQKVSFLDMLLQSSVDGQPLSDEDIREEVDTFMFEGHDTTASAICFTLYNISQHPEMQKKICEELDGIFGDDKHRTVNSEDLKSMIYLEMFIKETLRLYPSVPLFARCLSEDFVIGDEVFKEGTRVAISPFINARLEQYFPEPMKFIPERFASENVNSIKPFTYLPFSAGQRNCVGQKFAMMEIKCIISKILRNFEIVPDDECSPTLTYEIILKSASGIWMKFREK